MACVIVPGLHERRRVLVMFTAVISGFPSMVAKVSWASIVLPCGIDAMRISAGPSYGSVVAGMAILSPGSTWMPMGWRGTVTSVSRMY